jgi:Flp pilus assembly protein TadG
MIGSGLVNFIRRRRLRVTGPLLRDRDGMVSIEAAIVFSAFFILLFGVMSLGELLWTQNSLTFAVSQAVRCAAIDVNNCGNGTAATNAKVQAYAAALAPAPGITASDFTLATTGLLCLATNGVATSGFQVTGTLTFSPVVFNLFPMFQITLTSRACYPAPS